MIASGIRYPENLFAGSSGMIEPLREAIEIRQGR
jgi:hypothetical protein